MATNREIFGDTSGWAAFFVRTEIAHSDAVAQMRRWQADGVRVVTTNYVITELTALLMRPLRINFARRVQIGETIRTATWVEVVYVDAAIDAEAWTLLKQRGDKNWSLVDCASFVVMRRRGITHALTRDHNFEQAGFERLLR